MTAINLGNLDQWSKKRLLCVKSKGDFHKKEVCKAQRVQKRFTFSDRSDKANDGSNIRSRRCGLSIDAEGLSSPRQDRAIQHPALVRYCKVAYLQISCGESTSSIYRFTVMG